MKCIALEDAYKIPICQKKVTINPAIHLRQVSLIKSITCNADPMSNVIEMCGAESEIGRLTRDGLESFDKRPRPILAYG